MTHQLHRGDLPEGLRVRRRGRDRHRGDGAQPASRPAVPGAALGAATATRISCNSPPAATTAPNLRRLLADPAVLKLFHFARFDIAILYHYLGVMPQPLYCTKIASRLVRTFTDRHGLRDLCKDLLGRRFEEAAAELGLGRADAERGAAALRRLGCAASARAADPARRDAGARTAHRAGAQPASSFCRRARLLDLAGWAEQDIFAH